MLKFILPALYTLFFAVCVADPLDDVIDMAAAQKNPALHALFERDAKQKVKRKIKCAPCATPFKPALKKEQPQTYWLV